MPSRHRPEQRQRHDQDEAVEPSGKPDLAVFEPEAAALEIGEQGLDAPAQAIIEGRVDRGRLRQGDDPGFGMAGLVVTDVIEGLGLMIRLA